MLAPRMPDASHDTAGTGRFDDMISGYGQHPYLYSSKQLSNANNWWHDPYVAPYVYKQEFPNERPQSSGLMTHEDFGIRRTKHHRKPWPRRRTKISLVQKTPRFGIKFQSIDVAARIQSTLSGNKIIHKG